MIAIKKPYGPPRYHHARRRWLRERRELLAAASTFLDWWQSIINRAEYLRGISLDWEIEARFMAERNGIERLVLQRHGVQ